MLHPARSGGPVGAVTKSSCTKHCRDPGSSRAGSPPLMCADRFVWSGKAPSDGVWCLARTRPPERRLRIAPVSGPSSAPTVPGALPAPTTVGPASRTGGAIRNHVAFVFRSWNRYGSKDLFDLWRQWGLLGDRKGSQSRRGHVSRDPGQKDLPCVCR